MTGTSALSVRGATHDYSGVRVLHGVDLSIHAGAVHALVGENGSGKSTLVRILTGTLRPTAGSLAIDDREVTFASPPDARRAGVGVVHQDYNLFPDLSVAANVYGVSKPPPRRRVWRTVDRRQVETEVCELFDELDIAIAPQRLVKTLDPAERKFVEIARAMLLEPRFLILDEATASLEPPSAQSVLGLLDRLRIKGLGLCFVSHRLDEVMAIANRVTVLRDGSLAGRLDVAQTSQDELIDLIVGGAKPRKRKPPGSAEGGVLARISSLRLHPHARPVELDVRRGEILGLMGLLGSGAATVARMLGGAEPLIGIAELEGKPARIRNPRHASKVGIGFIPEDRKGSGLVADHSVAVNVSLASLAGVCPRGVLRKGIMRDRADHFCEQLSIRTSSVDAPVRTLSGGNQQKVMIAKWLASEVRLLAIEEPTHGVDVGAKVQIHDLLREFVAEGRTVVIASTDAHEVVELCDRIAVFRHGELTDLVSAEALERVDGGREPAEILTTLVSGTSA